MAVELTPGQLLKVWNRIEDRFGLPEGGKDKNKKPSARAKEVATTTLRITRGLTRLRDLSAGEVDSAAKSKFEATRDRTARSLRAYCKLLKGDELKGELHHLLNLRRAVKQLTVLVEGLAAKSSAVEDADVKLAVLDGVDTSALDTAMRDPKFGEYAEEELKDEDEAMTPVRGHQA